MSTFVIYMLGFLFLVTFIGATVGLASGKWSILAYVVSVLLLHWVFSKIGRSKR